MSVTCNIYHTSIYAIHLTPKTKKIHFEIEMAIFKSAIVIFAIVVSLFSLMAKGELITKCIVAYAQECPDQESSAGIEKCCSLMVNLYKNDADCLCSIFEYTTTDDEAANKKLSNCSITTQVPFSCNFNRERILEG